MRLVFPRAAAARTLLVAAAFAATVTTVLLTAMVLYAQLLPIAGVRAAVRDAPAEDRSVLVRSPAGSTAGELSGRDTAVRDLFADALNDAAPVVTGAGYASGQELPTELAEPDTFPVVGFLTDLDEHAELVGGAWPTATSAGAPVEVALPAPVADDLDLATGDELAIVDGRGAEPEAVPVVVVGVWRAVDPTDPYWRLLAAPLERGGVGPFVVHRDEFVARYQRRGTLEWVAIPEPGLLATAGMADVAADVRALTAELAERQRAGGELDEFVHVHTGVGELAERLEVATVVTRSGLVLPAALLAVIAGFGLVLVARLLAMHRHGENALLRARGAGRGQLVWFSAAEALLVVAPAVLLGPVLATRLVGFAGDQVGSRGIGFSADLAGYGLVGPPLAWLVAIVTAAGCAVALAVPAAGRGRTWVAEQQERSRPGRAAMLQRAGVDVALVAVAVLAWLQLRQYGSAVTPTDAGLGIDPLLVAAPVVGVVAATAVSLRLLPIASRLGVRVVERRNAFPSLLGMWQADRRPHAGPVLLVVLAIAIAVVAPTVAATWQRSQRDQAAREVGADLRVTVTDPLATGTGAGLRAALPAATGVMPAYRGVVDLPDNERTALLALDSELAPGVAQVRPDLSTAEPGALFGGLHQGRPELIGLPLPEGVARLAGRFRFVAPQPRTYVTEYIVDGETVVVEERLPSPQAGGLSLHVLDETGAIRSVRVGPPAGDDGSWLDLDVALPVGAVELVGLGAGTTTDEFFGLVSADAEPVPVSWQWQDLRAVDASGAQTPIEIPDSWNARVFGGSAPDPEWTPQDGLAALELQPARDFPVDFQLLVAPPAELEVVPVVVTPDVLAATGAAPGDTLSLTSGGIELPAMRAVQTVAAMPGTTDGSGVAVDLAWLAIHQFLNGRQGPLVNEWWIAEPAGSAAAVAELEWVGAVFDRQAETRRLQQSPLGSGLLVSLWAAAAAAGVLAGFGLVVDARATALRRRKELAVLHTLGTGPPALARALVTEQAVLAGLGVVAGAMVGVGVAAAMGTSLVLTPAGEVPVPVPLLTMSPPQFVAAAAGLFALAVVLGAAVARRAKRELAAGALRIGED